MSHSQDMIFTLYGDYIRHRGGEAWTGSLIELLGLFDLSAQAIRSTLSRMSRKGWLKSRRISRYSFYSLTPKCIQLLEEGAKRIFHPRSDPWDGHWHLLTYSIPETKRHLRRRLRRRLRWLGFGTLNHATWISPRDLKSEVQAVLDDLDLHTHVEFFSGKYRGFTSEEEIVSTCWDLERLNKYYADFVQRYESSFKEHKRSLEAGEHPNAEKCYLQRFMLIHEYRASPYVDPNLPLELLPGDWLGGVAAELFQSYRDLLAEGAEAYIDSILGKAPKL
jgi:phenylacetic acid degradation operon negative regulatory protein